MTHFEICFEGDAVNLRGYALSVMGAFILFFQALKYDSVLCYSEASERSMTALLYLDSLTEWALFAAVRIN